MLGRFQTSGESQTNRRGFRKRGVKRTLAVFAFVFVLLLAPTVTGAQVDAGLNAVGAETGLTTTDIRVVAATIINAFFGLMGILLVGLFIYGGYLYMTAGGDSSKVDRAKSVLINAVIGTIIILLSYAIAAFIVNAITGRSLLPGGTSDDGSSSSLSLYHGGTSHLLGNGIIEYHYPETGQDDVPRNTRISITLKRPIALESIIRGYDDNDTFTSTDDTVDGEPVADVENFVLNTDVIKIIPNESLQPSEGANPDERFESRYSSPEVLVDPGVNFTPVNDEYNPTERQTVTIIPAEYLGSSVVDVNYRVALRGGDNGIMIWSPDPATGEPLIENALDMSSGDGGYYWPFTVGTSLDLSAPTISAVVPRVHLNPGSDMHPRNQLLQIYFSEPMDATTASGVIGEGGGFTNIEVKARCLELEDGSCDEMCLDEFGACDTTSYQSVPGTIILSSRYRTAEFIPSAECEGVPMNSCGEPVYCLPENVEIRVRVKAATVSEENPPMAIAFNGPLDMVGNSLDGNQNGTAEGPDGSGYYLNNPPADLAGIGDTVRYLYQIGDDIDLTPPIVLNVSPKSTPPEDVGEPDYPDGPFNVPPGAEVEVIWSKVMSVSSMRTGAYNDDMADSAIFTTDDTTLALRASEREKENLEEECPGDESCAYIELDPPHFFPDLGDGPIEVDGEDVSRMVLRHRQFLTANDLGWSEEEIEDHVEYVPIYQPVIGAKIKDSRQNCFYPSEYDDCVMSGNNSCCNRIGVEEDRYTCSLIDD